MLENAGQKGSKDFWRFGFQQHMGLLFTVLVLATGLTLAFAGYRMVSKTIISANNQLVRHVAETVTNWTIYGVRRPIQVFINALAQGSMIESRSLEMRLNYLSRVGTVLSAYPLIDSLVYGYDNGDFLRIRRLTANSVLLYPEAPPGSVWAVHSLEVGKDGGRTTEHLFFDNDFRLLLRVPITNNYDVHNDYDVHTRPWYREAMKTNGLTITEPYWSFAGQIVVTLAMKNRAGDAVVGVSMNLSELSNLLAHDLPSERSHLALFRSDGTLVAAASGMVIHEKSGTARARRLEDLPPVLRLGMQAYQAGWRGDGINISDGERDWILSVKESGVDEKRNAVTLLAIPKDEVLADAVDFLHHTVLIMLGILILSVPLVWVVARRVSTPLRTLAEKIQQIQQFRFEKQAKSIDSRVEEIHVLTEGVDYMWNNIQQFLAITQTISAERNFDTLLEHVLNKTLAITGADGGLLTLLGENGSRLKDGYVCWMKGREIKCTPANHAELEAQLPVGEAILRNTIVQTVIERADQYGETTFLAPGFADNDVERIDVVCIPLHDRMGENLGVLALFKAIRTGACGFQAQQVSFIEAVASTAAIALENQSLIEGQRELRDALIRILAGAIDAKSPDTGGHCQRVPVIFQMLLQAACNANEGPLKDFTLDEDGWEEAKLAGWLHDCGKITTPEYVMDKATKLETLYDRIHEIRTRFEVLKRDAEISCLRAILDGADEGCEQRKLDEALCALDDDFAFVASCNAGSESMDDAAVERLAAIGKRTWLRTLDKRLGISHGERARMDRTPTPELPTLEPLLMDCPEHIIERGEKDLIPPDKNRGFKIKTPSALYNRGELYNLSIRRGTLTEEERYKINDHITQTILMLDQLPLPRHLRNVPEIVGSHHETMDGKGYPRSIKREEMSWSARMMAVSDIFEALTASDRPYKSSKTLSEALKIMDGFKARNHIDPDVYELFLQAGVPQQYAAQYLRPEQNDL